MWYYWEQGADHTHAPDTRKPKHRRVGCFSSRSSVPLLITTSFLCVVLYFAHLHNDHFGTGASLVSSTLPNVVYETTEATQTATPHTVRETVVVNVTQTYSVTITQTQTDHAVLETNTPNVLSTTGVATRVQEHTSQLPTPTQQPTTPKLQSNNNRIIGVTDDLHSEVSGEIELAYRYRIQKRVLMLDGSGDPTLLGTRAPTVGTPFSFDLTNTDQEEGTADTLYIKVVSENTRQVAEVVTGNVTKFITKRMNAKEWQDPLFTPQLSMIRPMGEGKHMAHTVRLNRTYTANFTPAEPGQHTIVVRLLLKNVPDWHNNATNQTDPVEPAYSAGKFYRRRDEATLITFDIFVHPRPQNQDTTDHAMSPPLPKCNYTGMSRGVWVKKGSPLAAQFSSTVDRFWTDSHIWVPAPGAMCQHVGLARPLPQQPAISLMRLKNIKKIVMIGDSIIRELYLEVSTFFTWNHEPFNWKYASKTHAFHDTLREDVAPGAPEISFRWWPEATRPPPVDFEKNCYNADVVIFGHGLWSLRWGYTPEQLTDFLTNRVFEQVFLPGCKRAIEEGRGFFVSVPASPLPQLSVRTFPRIRRFNSVLADWAAQNKLKLIDMFHWSEARPEGTDDGTHFGNSEYNEVGAALRLGRTTMDLWLNSLLNRQGAPNLNA
eukprot:comp70709_c0_seq1/m.48112 comp70709_c0_seq1/g.48112  ORF comp70709_c0_seq1/g.48112 comp70709_c0_seq1/m.48112 type:complete len:658 (-) comp70709_c0_seq1:116-2089(-)